MADNKIAPKSLSDFLKLTNKEKEKLVMSDKKPEVRAEVVKIQGGVDAGKFYVALLVNDKHFDTWGSTNELTEAEAKLIADHINADPAEIEARVRKELAIKIKGLMIFSYTRYDEWGHDIGSESFDRDKVLAIIEG